MSENKIIQGRTIVNEDILLIKRIMSENPAWGRYRISRKLCEEWNWYTPYGMMKDMAARSLLLKLEARGLIQLPSRMIQNNNRSRKDKIYNEPHDTTPISKCLKRITPICINIVKSRSKVNLFKTYLKKYHYLGFNTVVGENIKYLVSDKNGKHLGCLLFGAAAWKTAPRDEYIGWNAETRKRNLFLIANNSRFLIFPWVSVKHLASHILGKVAKRISEDWIKKYSHAIYLLETFVLKDRFPGICYKASNWIYLGDTKGRGKKDIKNEYALPVKSVWTYPLTLDFRKHLCR